MDDIRVEQQGGQDSAPRTDTERALLAVFSEVLKVSNIGIYDDFIDIGGHSLSATLCINRIQNLFGVELPLDVFFLEPATIAEISSVIDGIRREQAPAAGRRG